MRGYRVFKRLAWRNAAAMVRDSDLDQIFGEDVEDEEMEAASKAQADVADAIDRNARPPNGGEKHE